VVVAEAVVAVGVVWGGMEQPGHEVDQSFHIVLRLKMRRVLPPLPFMPALFAQRLCYLYFVSKFW